MRTETTGSVTTEDVLNALGRYASESNESDRQTAAQLGVSRLTLKAWLRGVAPSQRKSDVGRSTCVQTKQNYLRCGFETKIK